MTDVVKLQNAPCTWSSCIDGDGGGAARLPMGGSVLAQRTSDGVNEPAHFWYCCVGHGYCFYIRNTKPNTRQGPNNEACVWSRMQEHLDPGAELHFRSIC